MGVAVCSVHACKSCAFPRDRGCSQSCCYNEQLRWSASAPTFKIPTRIVTVVAFSPYIFYDKERGTHHPSTHTHPCRTSAGTRSTNAIVVHNSVKQ